jgi:hypothetical protein
VSAASAQSDIEILSKEDAAQVFALSKAQWRENLVAVVKAGLGTRTGDALTLKAPKGVVTTLPIYSQTDARPSRLEVTVVMEREDVTRFDDAMVADMMQYMRRQMEPEYIATGRAERILGGGMRFLFTVSEKPRELAQRPASGVHPDARCPKHTGA